MTPAASEDDRTGPDHAWPDAPDPGPLGGPPTEPPERPLSVVVGATALVLGAGVQLGAVAILLTGQVERPPLAPLAITAGLATMGMIAAFRAWGGRDWRVAVTVGSLELLVGTWLFGFEPIGWLLTGLFSIALLGLARARPWFRAADDDLAR